MAKEKTPMIKAVLHLEDGTQFEGTSIGAIGTTIGEIAFNTGMYGYQEIFTDPSYYGQILVMATAHIGNYATLKREEESDRVQLRCRGFAEVFGGRWNCRHFGHRYTVFSSPHSGARSYECHPVIRRIERNRFERALSSGSKHARVGAEQ
jgi:hypothetical protein